MFKRIKAALKDIISTRLIAGYNRYGIPFAVNRHLTGKTGLTVLDIGAHDGLFSSGLELLFGIRRGILVELQPQKIPHLRRKFPAPRFEVVWAAVSNQAGEMDVEINSFDATTSILKTKRDLPDLASLDVRVASKVRCPVVTLDIITEKAGINDIDLLKIDVQGAEHLVICGGATTLSKTNAVWVEVSFKPLYEGSCLYNEVFDLFRGHGFTLWDLEPGFRSPDGELVQADALFFRS